MIEPIEKLLAQEFPDTIIKAREPKERVRSGVINRDDVVICDKIGQRVADMAAERAF